MREDFVCQVLNRTASQWIDDQDRVNFFVQKLGIPKKWISGAKALWYKYKHQHELEFEAYLEAEAYPEAFSVFSQVLGPDVFLRETNAVTHAFVPFACAELKAKTDALSAHKTRLHKAQQEELHLYQVFVSMMESGSRGELRDLSFESFLETFAARVHPNDLPQSEKLGTVVTKMCTVYAESLRYSSFGGDRPGTCQKATNHINAAGLPHMTPEEALAHIQDASSILGALT